MGIICSSSDIGFADQVLVGGQCLGHPFHEVLSDQMVLSKDPASLLCFEFYSAKSQQFSSVIRVGCREWQQHPIVKALVSDAPHPCCIPATSLLHASP